MRTWAVGAVSAALLSAGCYRPAWRTLDSSPAEGDVDGTDYAALEVRRGDEEPRLVLLRDPALASDDGQAILTGSPCHYEPVAWREKLYCDGTESVRVRDIAAIDVRGREWSWPRTAVVLCAVVLSGVVVYELATMDLSYPGGSGGF